MSLASDSQTVDDAAAESTAAPRGDERPALPGVLNSRWWLVLLAVWLPLHFLPLFSSTKLEDNGDICALFWPGHVFAANEMQAGRMPLWNPYQYSGTAFHAGMQAGVAYPLNWPLRLVGDPLGQGVAAINAQRLIHLTLLAAGIAWLVGVVFGCGWAAGVLVAIAFTGSTYIASHLSHLNQLQTLSWGPWIIGVARRLAIEGGRLRRGGDAVDAWPVSLRRACVLAVLMTMALLAGHPQNLYYILGFCALLMPAWLWCAASVERDAAGDVAASPGLVLVAARRVVWFLGAGALSVGLAAVQVLPTITATRLAWTAAEGRDYAIHLALPPIGLLGYVMPSFFGRASDPGSTPYPDWAFHEFGLYFGIVPLLLALGAMMVVVGRNYLGARDPGAGRLEVACLFLVWLVCGLVALGNTTPLWGLAYDWVPMFGSLRAHARTLLPGHFALVILAGTTFAMLGRVIAAKAPDGATARSSALKLAIFAIVVTVIDLGLASRGADFRDMHEFEPTLDSEITRAIEAGHDEALAERRHPGRLFWMIREDNYFARGPGAHGLRASQLTPNNNTAAGVELTHGYGESLQPTLRYRDFLYTFNRNFYQARPDVDLLRMMGVEWVLTDIDAPLDLGDAPVATSWRLGASPLRLWRIEPLPRVMSESEIHNWSARLDFDVREALGYLDGMAHFTGTPIAGRNNEAINWRPEPYSLDGEMIVDTSVDSDNDPEPGTAMVPVASRIVLEPSDDPARQPFEIVGGPARELVFLMGAFPGWELHTLPPAGTPNATAPTLPTGVSVEPMSAVAWRVTTAPSAPLAPGRYEFVYVGEIVREGFAVSAAALILLLLLGGVAFVRRPRGA